MDRDTPLSLDAMDRMLSSWDVEARDPRSIILSAISHHTESLDWFMRAPRSQGPIILGGRKRIAKGAPPPKANDRRAKVKAARKANRQRKSA